MEAALLKLIGGEVLKLTLKMLADWQARGGDLERLMEAARRENERDIYEVLGIERPQ